MTYFSVQECGHCGLTFVYRNQLVRHIFSCHMNLENGKLSFVCAMCKPQFSTPKKVLILKHYEGHGLKIESESYRFPDAKAFEDWKTNVEARVKCAYVKRNSCQGAKEKSILFQCHGSGTYTTQGADSRSACIVGSEKINVYCPSEIRLYIDNVTGRHNAVYTKPHVGHGEGIEYVHEYGELKRETDEAIAPRVQKLNTNRRAALDESETSLLNVLESSGDSGDACADFSDSEKIRDWISKNEDCVLHYKEAGCRSDEYAELDERDFVLVITNDFQEDCPSKYGDVIMVDRSSRLTTYGVELNAVMVVDDLRQGIPASFMFSNRNDRETLRVFFTEIRRRFGVLRPKIFISDLRPEFVDAWTEVHGAPEKRFYCSWCVNRDWSGEMKRVKGTAEYKMTVRSMLRDLQMEMNPVLFHQKLDTFAKTRKRCLADFVQYFKENYASTHAEWAYYCRQHAGVNTILALRNFLKNVSAKYASHLETKDVSEAVVVLVEIVKSLLHSRMVGAKEGKLTTKISTLRLLHNRSVSEERRRENITILGDGKWYVPNFEYKSGDLTFENKYLIEQVADTCRCKMRCQPCNACVHMYKCSCITCSVEGYMCKHIHMLCSWRNRQKKVFEEALSDDEIVSISVEEKPADNV